MLFAFEMLSALYILKTGVPGDFGVSVLLHVDGLLDADDTKGSVWVSNDWWHLLTVLSAHNRTVDSRLGRLGG
jgi:hypothetical protein